MRIELADTSIHVSLIEPGPILSDFRANAVIAMERDIDIEHSIYRDRYHSVLKRLKKEGAAVPFTLPADAVLKKVRHALESSRPKKRYYVTVPTYLFAYLKRLLPVSLLDKMLAAAGGNGKR